MFNYENINSTSIQRQYMTTRDVPKPMRFYTWHGIVQSIFPNLQLKKVTSHSDFLASASICKFDRHILAVIDTADAIYHSQGIHAHTQSFWLCLYFPISICGEINHTINRKSIRIPHSAGTFFIFDERHKFVVNASTGKAILLQLSIDDPNHKNKRIWQQLNPELAAALIRQHNLFPLLQQHLFDLHRIILDEDAISLSYLLQYALQLLEEILQSILFSMSQENETDSTAYYKGIYYAAEQYILDQMDRELKPDDLSDALGISRTTLFRAFTTCNTTPQQHIVRLKLEKLYQLLAKKSCVRQHISTLVYRCGFNNIDQAGKLFKKHYGMTMSGYRKRIHMQHEPYEQ